MHHVPGRIRIKIPDIKGKPFYAQELGKKLKLIPGVCIVNVNSLTEASWHIMIELYRCLRNSRSGEQGNRGRPLQGLLLRIKMWTKNCQKPVKWSEKNREGLPGHGDRSDIRGVPPGDACSRNLGEERINAGFYRICRYTPRRPPV